MKKSSFYNAAAQENHTTLLLNVCLILTITLVLVLSSCNQETTAKSTIKTTNNTPNTSANGTSTRTDAIPIKTAPVLIRAASATVHTTGLLATKDEFRLSFKIGGVIESVKVRDGESIRKGQVLALLNRAEINAQVAQAQQAADKAKRDMERVQALYNERALTLEQTQNATTAYEVAAANLKIATFNQQYASITAPASGKVLKVIAKAGELAGVGNPVVVISSESSGWVVRVGLSDRDIVRLRVGNKAAVRFDAFPNETFAATVSDVKAAASQQTGTFEAELSLQPNGKKFVTGLVASVDITTSANESVAFVPIEAVVEGNGMTASVYALTENDTKVQKLPVQIAFIQGTSVAIKQGLNGVQQVVTDGVEYLADGASVRVIAK
jgi:RND family efflux transporter MFP subunit